MEDRQFTTMFMAVLVVLVGFTIAILVIANLLYSDDGTSDLRVQKAVAERIKPVGEVYIGSVPSDAGSQSTATVSTVAAADLSGDQVYTQVCASCHAAGVLNAPIPGDAAAWSARLEKRQRHCLFECHLMAWALCQLKVVEWICLMMQ